jgi:uncharacterized membrane protein
MGTNGYANARALSADGSVIGGEWMPDQRNSSSVVAAYWTNGIGPYEVSEDQSSMADGVTSVSDSGLNLTGTFGHIAYWRADDGTLFSITNDTLNVVITRGLGMSRNGQFVVGEDAAQDTDGNFIDGMFRWSPTGGLELLGHASDDSFARAFAVSNDGSTIVGADNEDQFSTSSIALIWRPQWDVRHLQEVLTNDYGLDLTGWHLLSGRAVSVDGTVIVGNGINPSGKVEAFIATIDRPQPRLVIQCNGVNCVLSWPTNANGFALQQCSNLSITNWTAASNAPTVVGNQFNVTNMISSSTAYFRLKGL